MDKKTYQAIKEAFGNGKEVVVHAGYITYLSLGAEAGEIKLKQIEEALRNAGFRQVKSIETTHPLGASMVSGLKMQNDAGDFAQLIRQYRDLKEYNRFTATVVFVD